MTRPEEKHAFVVCLAPGGAGDSKITQLVDAPDAELTRLLASSNFALGPVTDDHRSSFILSNGVPYSLALSCLALSCGTSQALSRGD